MRKIKLDKYKYESIKKYTGQAFLMQGGAINFAKSIAPNVSNVYQVYIWVIFICLCHHQGCSQ